MNENHIDIVVYHNVKDKRDFFQGSFALDELSHDNLQVDNLNEPRCFSFIFNTLSRSDTSKIGHWLAVYVKIAGKKVHFKFADSFAQPYTFYGKNVKDYADSFRELCYDHNAQFIFEEMPFRVQAFNSYACGAYAVYTILGLQKCKYKTLHSIFSSFDIRNKLKNDLKIEEYVVKKWPRTFCTDVFTPTNKTPFCSQKVFMRPGCLLECCCEKNCSNKVRSVDHYIRPNIKYIFS